VGYYVFAALSAPTQKPAPTDFLPKQEKEWPCENCASFYSEGPGGGTCKQSANFLTPAPLHFGEGVGGEEEPPGARYASKPATKMPPKTKKPIIRQWADKVLVFFFTKISEENEK